MTSPATSPRAPRPRPSCSTSPTVATITLNRPEAMNGLDVATKDLLLRDRATRRATTRPCAASCSPAAAAPSAWARTSRSTSRASQRRGRRAAVRHGREALQPDRAGAVHHAEARDRRGQRRRGGSRGEPGLRRRLPDPGRHRRLQHLLRRRRAVLRHRFELDAAAPGRAAPRRWSCSTSPAPSGRRGARAGPGQRRSCRQAELGRHRRASSPRAWPPGRPSRSARSGRQWRTPPRTRSRTRSPSRPRRWRSPAAPRTTSPRSAAFVAKEKPAFQGR